MSKDMFLDGLTIFGMQDGRLLGDSESGKEGMVDARSLLRRINNGIRNIMDLMASISSEPTAPEFDSSARERRLKNAIADLKVEVSLVVDGRILFRQIVKQWIWNW